MRTLRLDTGRMNLLTTPAVKKLRSELRAVCEDPATRAVALFGRDDGFCAGLDTKALAVGDAASRELFAEMGGLLIDLYAAPVPLVAGCAVLALGDGRFTATGPMWGGSRMDLGPMALVETDGVRVIIASKAMQAGDQAMFRHLGIEPADQPILGLKSSVHFRADFQPIAREILIVEAPGPVHADPAKLDFRRLRKGVDLRPGE